MSDFTNETDFGVPLTSFELDEGVDFVQVGDFETTVIAGLGWGDGGWGDLPWGGEDDVIVLSSPVTQWTNIDTP